MSAIQEPGQLAVVTAAAVTAVVESSVGVTPVNPEHPRGNRARKRRKRALTQQPAVGSEIAALPVPQPPPAARVQPPQPRKPSKPKLREQREPRRGWVTYEPTSGVACDGVAAFNDALHAYKQLSHQTAQAPLLGMGWWSVNLPQTLSPGTVAHDRHAGFLADVPVPVDSVRCLTLRCESDGVLTLSESMPFVTDECVEFGRVWPRHERDKPQYTYRYSPEAGAALTPIYVHQPATEPIPTEFSTPRYGKLTIYAENNLRELYVDGQLIYVIKDATQATICAQTGQHVRDGAVLFSAPRNTVLVAVYDRRVLSRRVPDARRLDASRPMLLEVMTHWLQQLVELRSGRESAPALPLPVPAMVAALSQDASDLYVTDPDNLLMSRPAFQAALLSAVGPDGDFAIRAPRTGELLLVEQQPWFNRYSVAGTTFTVPSVCAPFMQCAPGDAVTAGRVVATWGDRVVQDWSALTSFCGIHLSQICRDFFTYRCLCRDGGTYVPYGWLSAGVDYEYLALDFAGARRYASNVRNWLASPMVVSPGSSLVRGVGPVQVRLD